jgi:hypothetical protein
VAYNFQNGKKIKPQQTSIAEQRLGNYVSAAMNINKHLIFFTVNSSERIVAR